MPGRVKLFGWSMNESVSEASVNSSPRLDLREQ
jgi:hypothetical protein